MLVIGVDGLEWSVLRPLIAAGRCPNLRGLMERGAFGRLLLQVDKAEQIARLLNYAAERQAQLQAGDPQAQRAGAGGLVRLELLDLLGHQLHAFFADVQPPAYPHRISASLRSSIGMLDPSRIERSNVLSGAAT